MVLRTYGKIEFDKHKDEWHITAAEPHVRIKLKGLFNNLSKTNNPPYTFQNSLDRCADLYWFLLRYPLEISETDMRLLSSRNKLNTELINELESIMLPKYKPGMIKLKEGRKPYKFQLVAKDIFDRKKRMLLADDMGLGKTLTSILAMLDNDRIPAAVVCETTLPNQWKEEVEHWTNLKCHIINSTRPYNLPEADVYIFKYSNVAGWNSLFDKRFFKYAIFDECQQLRTGKSDKCHASRRLSESVDWCMGLSATPIYNYGGEVFNVLDVIKPGCLGSDYEFMREWTDGSWQKPKLRDAEAFGTYAKEIFLIVRRTREEVGMAISVVNKLLIDVPVDFQAVEDEHAVARQLAMRVLDTSLSFTELGEVSREFSMRLRHLTGVAKAKGVAAYVRILLDAGHPVICAAWHRDVYRIWNEELKEYNPVMYTGSETSSKKRSSFKAFTSGKTKLMFISIRSGAGLNGLQFVAKYVVHGELDYSPQPHNQLTGRLDRPGQTEQVTSIFPLADFGSDPALTEILGLKSSQLHGIINPLRHPGEQFSDDTMLKEMARMFLKQSESAIAM